jgi:hypothetical protein
MTINSINKIFKLSIATIFAITISFAGFAQSSSKSSGDFNKLPEDIGKNIVGFSPIALFTSHYFGVNGFYQKQINKNIAFRLPVMVGVDNHYFNAAPELRIYPFGQYAINYSLGGALFYGYGILKANNNVPNPSTVDVINNSVGFLFNQSLEATILRNYYIGSTLGLGVNYVNDYKGNQAILYNYQEGTSLAVQFNLHFGVRF